MVETVCAERSYRVDNEVGVTLSNLDVHVCVSV